jgi:predicted lipid-binding transport protein (Tim44 family)
MNTQNLISGIPQQWWDRLRGAQFGFIGGLLIGLLLGWFFHGIISLAVRMGVLLLLLLPLIAIAWLWFRSQRATRSPQSGPGTVVTWTAVGTMPRQPPPPAPNFGSDVLVDVPVVKPTDRTRPDEIEAQLEALKRQQERGA